MKIKLFGYFASAILIFHCYSLQGQVTVEEYIETYRDLSISEMKKYRIPASIKLAQGILESASGNSELATKARNHFGIKCHKGWQGKTFIMDDDEKNECFRKYGSVEDSYRDHSEFLTTRDRYSSLFSLRIDDYKGWAKGLKKAGYATNPRYPDLLIKIIEENELYLYDRKGAGRKTIARIEAEEKSPALVLNSDQLEDSKVFSEIVPIETSPDGRNIYLNNGVKFIFAREGDDFYTLAHEFDIYAWQIWKYNELEKTDRISKGQVIYLEKKKRRADKVFPEHVVKEDENLGYISQIYAVRLKRLRKMNGIEPGDRLSPGQIVRLR
jgi:hypothetical protein